MNIAPERIGTWILFPDRDLQTYVIEEHGDPIKDLYIGAIDAPEIIVSGACKRVEYTGFAFECQQTYSRGILDAYDYTDRTARVTDCASEGL